MRRPVVFTAVYGSDIYFQALALMLESLDYFGKYDGDIIVISDRSWEDVSRFVHQSAWDRVAVCQTSERDFGSRYSIGKFVGVLDGPLLHIDADIIVARPVKNILARIENDAEFYICNECEHLGQLKGLPVGELRELHELAPWYGYELFASDPSMRLHRLPMANGGLYGFKNRKTADAVANLVLSLYRNPGNTRYGNRYTDQPFLNYAAAMSGSVDHDFLAPHCSFLNVIDVAPKICRTFNHFLWARGGDKVKSMKIMLDGLKSGTTDPRAMEG